MSIQFEEESKYMPQDDLPNDESRDSSHLSNPVIPETKQTFKRFSTITAEEAGKWMDDFPLRREKFIAAVRDAKNRDLSS